MGTQLFCPSSPDTIILNTSRCVATYMHRIQDLSDHDLTVFAENTKTKIMDVIIPAIQFKEDALMKLSLECYQLQNDSVLGQYSGLDQDAVSEIVSAIYELGSNIHHQLIAHGLYENGYLRYQHASWIGHDAVLRRLLVDHP